MIEAFLLELATPYTLCALQPRTVLPHCFGKDLNTVLHIFKLGASFQRSRRIFVSCIVCLKHLPCAIAANTRSK